MNLHQLYYFKTLAKLEHYTKAAEALCMTQPSLSNAISTLESELGVRLFEKHGRNIKITRYGKLFLPYVENSLYELENGIKKIKEISSYGENVVSIGYIYTLSRYFIPNLINKFIAEDLSQNTKFSLEEGRTREYCSLSLVQGLKDERHDLIFISLIPDDSEVEYTCIGEQELVVLLPNNSPLAKYKAIDLKDTDPYSFIQFTGRLGLKNEINDLFKKCNMTPKISYEVADELSMAGLVAANLGFSIVPFSPKFGNYDIVVRPIKNPSYQRKIFLGYMKHRDLPPTAKRLKNYIIHLFTQKSDLKPSEYGLSKLNNLNEKDKKVLT